MKFALVAGVFACVLALAACTSTGQLTPAASAAVTTAYNDLCAGIPAVGPTVATLNAQLQNDYAQAETACAAGAPTNAIAAGVDLLALDAALTPYFAKK